MQTFLPYADFAETAKCIDSIRLNSQINECIVILKSNFGVYEPNPRTGASGWSQHPAALMWLNHDRHLVDYTIALCKEYLGRPLPKQYPSEALKKRRARLAKWRSLGKKLESLNFPLDPMPLIGDEDFHSAFRALLLRKDIEVETFRKFKRGEYPDHLCTRALLPKKSSWKRKDYEGIWEFFGQPDAQWYGKFGWTEEPNPDLVFYTTDRIPYIIRRKRIKATKPNQPWFNPKLPP